MNWEDESSKNDDCLGDSQERLDDIERRLKTARPRPPETDPVTLANRVCGAAEQTAVAAELPASAYRPSSVDSTVAGSQRMWWGRSRVGRTRTAGDVGPTE